MNTAKEAREFWERCYAAAITGAAIQEMPIRETEGNFAAKYADDALNHWEERFTS